jgi:hypothetical protein
MGATILKIDTSVKKPLTEKQKAFLKKLEEFPVMSQEQFKEYRKVNKWMGKWKI